MSETQSHFAPLFANAFGFNNFGESSREVNKQLVQDIEKERSESRGVRASTPKRGESPFFDFLDAEAIDSPLPRQKKKRVNQKDDKNGGKKKKKTKKKSNSMKKKKTRKNKTLK